MNFDSQNTPQGMDFPSGRPYNGSGSADYTLGQTWWNHSRQTINATRFVPSRSTPLWISMKFETRTKRYSLVALYALSCRTLVSSPPYLLSISLIF